MVVVCPVCREVVHTSNGYILSHGTTLRGSFSQCAGSETPYCSNAVSCCSD